METIEQVWETLTTCIIRRSSNATRLEPVDMQASKHNGLLLVSRQTYANTKCDEPCMTITNTISNGIHPVTKPATRHEHETLSSATETFPGRHESQRGLREWVCVRRDHDLGPSGL